MKKLSLGIALFCGLSITTAASLAEHNYAISDGQKTELAERVITNEINSIDNVLSVDVKYVNNNIHLLLGRKIKGQDSLWYQSSNDQGQIWSEAVNITAEHTIEARFHRGNDARLAVQGDHIVAVWMSKKEGVPHNSGPMVAMASHDAGKHWQMIDSPADWHEGAHGFFAMDANETTISLAWLDSRTKAKGKGAAQGLRYSSSLDGGQTWSTNETLDERTCACCWNTGVFNNDSFYVLYRDKEPSDMTLGRMDASQQWQTLSTVGQFDWDFQGCPHIGGSIAFDNSNQRAHATVGTGHPEHTGAYYLNSADMGESWNKPVRLGDDTAVHSDIAVANNGHLLAAWDHITATGFQIVHANSNDNGQNWTQSQALSSPGVRASHPRVIAMDNSFLVLWTESMGKKMPKLRVITVKN